MRLLYLTPESCPTFRADVTALFGKYLSRLGVQTDIVTGRSHDQENSIEWGGGDAILCDSGGGRLKRHLSKFAHCLWQLLVADARRYDAIQVRDMPILGVYALIIARSKGIHFCYWMSYRMSEGQIARAYQGGLSSGALRFLYTWLRGQTGRILLYHVVLPFADHVFVQSERMKQDLHRLGIESGKMTPVPMGVDLESMRPEAIKPIEDPRLNGKRVLVYLGSLDRPRKIEVLFQAISIVRQTEPGALLVLVGDTHDPEHRRWLEEQTRLEGVADHVLWTGWLPMGKGWQYVRRGEVGISPIPRGDLLDGASPTKVPEYILLGIPVVCNDNPDQRLMIEETGAGICVEYSAETFAAAILRLLDEPATSIRKRIDRGRRYIEINRSYDVIARLVFEKYHMILSEPIEKR